MAMNPDDLPSGGNWKSLDDDTVTSARKVDRDVRTWVIIAGVALLAAIVFVVQNSNKVDMDFLFFGGSQPLWLVIVLSMVLGALFGQAIGLVRGRRKKS
jgi:uncharacterized integral membrane protein